MVRRHSRFQTGHKPRGYPGFKLDETHVTGPVSFLNPTSAHYKPTQHPEDTHAPSQIERLWRSLSLSGSQGHSPDGDLRPLLDVSYLVALSFTIGSAVLIVNGFFVWLPLVDRKTEFYGEITVAGGWTGFVGATIFELGGVLLLLEAFNTNHTGFFGWALESFLEKTIEDGIPQHAMKEIKPRMSECEHHHANRKSFLREKHHHTSDNVHSHLDDTGYITSSTDGRLFRWIPSMSELRTHYFHEIGFIASFILFVSATVFWIGAIVGIPVIFTHISQGLIDGLYWGTTTLGGTGFTVSSLLYMLETQTKWYVPAWHVLGWHIGFWNLIGSIGLTLCAALGPASSNTGANYQSSLATFWGSLAFMIGSMIQWYESLQKHPVEKKVMTSFN
ncbi:hypothetical protein PENNAL_c0042G00592 [Penicillium nalgiovense]|uniref:Integral membrane protein n=1 Tax=Penicillium nalgiovense TaxID=60175 RepID=A0A1V6Y107_PENNA|nr:hypothetical protein PENNAL_c0042G00592 [Penicillium nalgiovense]